MLPLGLTFNAGDLDYVAKLQQLTAGVDELFNGYIASLGGGSFQATSASSVAIGTGTKTFTIASGKSFVVGMYLVIARTSAPTTTYMLGRVTSYSGTTLDISVPADSAYGSGTYTDWTISLTGPVGASGALTIATHTTNATVAPKSVNVITANSLTMTLPTAPIDGTECKFIGLGVTGTTIGRGGATIEGLSENMTISQDTRFSFSLVYRLSANDWRLI